MHEFFVFIIIIVAISMFGGTLQSYIKWKGRNAQRLEEERTDEHLQRLAQLEERIKVLERIVTDEQYDLKQRFRGL